jgi:hypothetical protein
LISFDLSAGCVFGRQRLDPPAEVGIDPPIGAMTSGHAVVSKLMWTGD